MIQFLETLISGLSLGSIYALIALGYTMVYGIAKMLNFAHGDVIMVGAYSVMLFLGDLAKFQFDGLPGILAIILGVVFCALLGVIIEFLAYRPLRKATPLSVLITAIGVSYFLQNLALIVFGSLQESFDDRNKIFSNTQVYLGPIKISSITLITLLVSAVIMVVLTLFINKTKMGKAMRAVSEDKQAAELMGISVNKTISVTFAIGSALAAIASIFYGGMYTFIKPTTGSMPGIKAFTAAVFGGIGSIPGAMLGGILLGVIEKLAGRYIAESAMDIVVFAVLVIVLVVRPAGLLGKKIKEKV